ncbi:hypothetical protein MNBD_DELTA01-2094 [hydrothermal vent metagenome]|uniref:phosphoglycolate phosphatase n=1 Tax=hydrothermal vent metagenome TaxID=652676 RepID=A0A3B0RJI7_9ZZZZ
MNPELVIFDLDGTLIDSSDDIAWAANKTLLELGLAQMSSAQIKERIGWGVRFLLERLLPPVCASAGEDPEKDFEELLSRARDIFLGYYRKNLTAKTRPYPGALETLDYLSGLDKKIAIITNKPIDFTMVILDDLKLAKYFKVVLGGDSLKNRKPHPEPLFNVMAAFEVGAEDSVMVGDSSIDCEAARGAGVSVIGAAYGFRGREGLDGQGCARIIDSISELQTLIS